MPENKPEMKKFFVGVKAIIEDPEKGVLLLKVSRENRSFWEGPGGRIDDNETFTETLTRELNEELPGSSNVQILELLGSERIHRDIEENIGLVLLYYKVAVDLPEPIELSHEHVDYTWLTKDGAMPTPCDAELRKIIEAWQAA